MSALYLTQILLFTTGVCSGTAEENSDMDRGKSFMILVDNYDEAFPDIY